MHDDAVRHVDSPVVLKALAHPLRVRLLGALRERGGGTATDLARALETDTGSTSYHLRVLARHGFVEEEPRAKGAARTRANAGGVPRTESTPGTTSIWRAPPRAARRPT